MVGDAIRQKGHWRGVRPGWNPAGVAAWGLGVLVGLVPLLGDLVQWSAARRFQPASLYAFLASAGFFLVFSALGRGAAAGQPARGRRIRQDESAASGIAGDRTRVPA